MTDTILIILAVGAGILLLGHTLIDVYFRRKEKFVDSLQGKIKGGSNGTTE